MGEIHRSDRLKNTINLLTALTPVLDELIVSMQKNNGWFILDNLDISPAIKNLKLENWAEFYLDEKTTKALPALFLLDEAELKEALDDPDKAKEKLKTTSLTLLEEDLFEISDNCDNDFIELPAEEQQQVLKQTSIMVLTMLLGLFSALSNMIHGVSLYTLVSLAKKGDDDAFCKAIQIDRTILFLPFAKERMIKAQLNNNADFLARLALKLKSPILGKKIKYRTLWLVFALLDDEGFLTLPHEELLNICEEIGVYGKKHGIEDVGHLRKRLADYKKKNWN